MLSGSPISITPVIIPQITMPLKRVNRSPTRSPDIKVPPNNKPIPLINSPQATKNHTVIVRPNACASSILNGNLDNP